MSSPKSFNAIAPFYDVLMSSVPYHIWVSYYELLLAQLEAEPRTILDVCCGTGNVTEILAQKGYEMAGVDLSAPMIVEAQRKARVANLKIDYLAEDAATFDFGRKFQAAFSFFDSFNYITDLGHLSRAIGRVAAHLEPGSSFVFDLNTAYAFEKKMFDQTDTRKKAPVKYKWVGNYDPKTRVIRVAMDFEHEGVKYREEHVQRAHSEDEMTTMLVDHGFVDIEFFDSYTLDPPMPSSDRIHCACRLRQ